MTHTPEQLDAIIAGLSKTQSKALLMMTFSMEKRWCDKVCSEATLRAIHRHGLTDWHNFPARITPLGLAVRARMMDTANETI